MRSLCNTKMFCFASKCITVILSTLAREKCVSVNFAAYGICAKMQAQQMTLWKHKRKKKKFCFFGLFCFYARERTKCFPIAYCMWVSRKHKVGPWDSSGKSYGPNKFHPRPFPWKAPSTQHYMKFILFTRPILACGLWSMFNYNIAMANIMPFDW